MSNLKMLPKSEWEATTTLASFRVAALFLLGLALLCGCENTTQQAAVEEQAAAQVREAEAGVGVRGQKTSQDQGVTKLLTGPVSALEHVKQTTVFDFQVKPLVEAYRASNGRYPSNQEFFELIDSSRIKLPELAAGSVYYFDTAAGKLMVYPEDQLPDDE